MTIDAVLPLLTEPVLTDDDVETLNQARTILDTLAKRCSTESWHAPRMEPGKANPASFGSVHSLATVAEYSLFTVLNWVNSHNVQPLTEAQIHNNK